ncbi:MFS transporter [Cellulomonas carbonis]|uniref:MFS transporter n=1 Tax=Cellulomonas carbonis T26 TaxID=947969 RepID=A0A0A0BS53_9CELL|nr:MFS transporter [Cellulomonas carbonis]KGM10781.1 MFS transporter [Cellulomonas carbonis T26]GGB92656.1 nitrate/nitrite transporter [Cellulomonas carbonis]
MSRLDPAVPLADWDPEVPERWDSRFAWRTLWVTTYNLTLAFCVWYLVSAIAPRLNQIGFDLSKEELYWLVAVPGLAGGLMRMVYMFLPPIVGTRTLVGGTATLMLMPMLGWTIAVRDATTPYWVLIFLAAAAGIGGGAFSGFMPSTSYFFPKRLQGTALGLQAGLGNFGVSLIQFLTPWVVGFGLLGTAALTPQQTATGEDMWLHNAGLVLVPWVVLGLVLAALVLRRVPVEANFRQQLDIFGEKHTWVMTAIYLMTFGAFSGFAAQFGLMIANEYGGFENPPDPLAFAFLGPLVGSLVRAALGPLCDRFGGAVWTLVSGIGMTVSTVFTIFFLSPTDRGQFTGFLVGMLAIFLFAGVGNAGTFKQMPMIFPKRQAGGVIGWTASVAAFGPFLVGIALSVMAPRTFFIGCAVYFAACTVLTWVYYARPGAPKPS